MERIDLLNTIKGSRFEGFFPEAWDLKKIEYCCSRKPEEVYAREPWWHKDFAPVCSETLDDFLPVRNMIYQGQTLWVTLKYGPDMWIPSSVMPQLPGKLFFIKPLAGPLEPEVN